MTFDLDNFLGPAPVIPTGPAPGAKPAPSLRLIPTPAPVTRLFPEMPAPGVYYGVPAWEYHTWPYISSTMLKAYAKRPSTARIPFRPGDDANVGSGLHAYCLQGEQALADECYFLPPECLGKGAKAVELRDYYIRLYPSKAHLPFSFEKLPIMEVLQGVDAQLKTHLATKLILANSQKEVSLVWIDTMSGAPCKCRLDIWDQSRRAIWDLKKTAQIDRFHYQIKDLFYGIQAGHYFNGAEACGLNPKDFGFIPCEAVPPFEVGVRLRDPEKLINDCLDAARLVSLLVQSKVSNNWPNHQIPYSVSDLDEMKASDLIVYC